MDEPGIPAQAPPFLWFLIIAAAALWWLWPWLERWQESRRTSAAPFSPAADAPPAVIQEPEPEEVEHEIIRPDVSFDSEEAFKAAYAEACRLVEELLQVPPMGHEFTAAAAGLHALANVVDRLFQEEDPRVAQLREDSESFGKSFASEGVRQLLCHAGFERRAMGRNGDGRAEWCFDHSDDSKLRALTVRLCIQRFTELQRLRGTHRWAQRDNSAVLPRASEASLEELLELYKTRRSELDSQRPSLRERNLEAEVRNKIQERRAEANCAPGAAKALALHEALASAARRLAQAQRVCEREGKEGLKLSDEVRDLLAKLPLPPGVSCAPLSFRSTELPRLFGLSSSTGRPNGEKNEDRAAEILAREAVGHWAARSAEALGWPYATVCGVGAALDYTVNRGFVVALLIGFDGCSPEAGAAERRGAMASLRRRQAAAVETAQQAAPAPHFGARVRTLDAPTTDAVLHRK